MPEMAFLLATTMQQLPELPEEVMEDVLHSCYPFMGQLEVECGACHNNHS
jgi:hypothetical protein